MTIILASTSSIRRKILEDAGLAIAVEKPLIDESELKSHQSALAPEALAQHLANAKCLSVSAAHPKKLVIGADQVLCLGNKVYDKPKGREEARSHLLVLRSKTHSLISAAACARAGHLLWQFTDRAELTMRRFSDSFLEDYLNKLGADATTSVGAYKIEGVGLQLFERIEGDYFTILGLPMLPLLEFLRSSGEIGP